MIYDVLTHDVGNFQKKSTSVFSLGWKNRSPENKNPGKKTKRQVPKSFQEDLRTFFPRKKNILSSIFKYLYSVVVGIVLLAQWTLAIPFHRFFLVLIWKCWWSGFWLSFGISNSIAEQKTELNPQQFHTKKRRIEWIWIFISFLAFIPLDIMQINRNCK